MHIDWALPKHWFTVDLFFFPIWLLLQVKLALPPVSKCVITDNRIDASKLNQIECLLLVHSV